MMIRCKANFGHMHILNLLIAIDQLETTYSWQFAILAKSKFLPVYETVVTVDRWHEEEQEFTHIKIINQV